ncbi:hypothetical protein SAMN04488688_102555 [Paenibacillus sp. cl141a]|uniref:hypothetical protein n=1 Tax=Paenibacillus sp. cl141a TaxID=1761877 RepID=UPI0008B9CFD7|nr:hypothetical protein [Paenibacillus sp. cl141a]SEK88834.1 hypothetical protein SAMN04488688_102555 [Paenibacillus sp. cl141a]
MQETFIESCNILQQDVIANTTILGKTEGDKKMNLRLHCDVNNKTDFSFEMTSNYA